MKRDMDKQFATIYDYVKNIVFSSLPDNLYYHHPGHTFKEVLPKTEELAELEHVKPEELFLLRIAAVFHDTGFIKCYFKNEPLGASIAEKYLASSGFSDLEINTVKKIIMATSMSDSLVGPIQSAGENILEHIICDADLDNFGRNDFFKRSDDLRNELMNYGVKMNDKDWYTHQIKLLKNHKYYTESAQKIRDEGKRRNLEELLRRFKECS
jgi:predicted metal-dependent HD superfamily phosphohydrolase